MKSLILIIWLSCTLLFKRSTAATCQYTVNGFNLDLTALVTKTLTYVASEGTTTFYYFYTPCRDGISCDDYNHESTNLTASNYMATQVGNKCNYLASWDASVQPVEEDNAYSFTYENGEDGYV